MSIFFCVLENSLSETNRFYFKVNKKQCYIIQHAEVNTLSDKNCNKK